MSEQGYARIYRTLLGHPAFRNDGEAMAFAWMVLRASWRPMRVRYKGQPVSLERGQLAVSVRDLADMLDRPKGWIERLISRLKTETMIETHAKTGVTVITICNYDEYQADQDGSRTADGTPKETAAGQQQDSGRTQNKEGKKGIKEEERGSEEPLEPAAAPKADPFPMPDFCPSEQVWQDLKANRKAKRLPCTATAHAKLLRDLQKLADDEWPPGRLLEAIVARGWAAAYDPREKTRDDRPPSSSARQTTRRVDGVTSYLEQRREARSTGEPAGPFERSAIG